MENKKHALFIFAAQTYQKVKRHLLLQRVELLTQRTDLIGSEYCHDLFSVYRFTHWFSDDMF